jgi:hypothetical protein|tara:strand:- start:183 stop:398 length:216 start_codon:yes stop_codon:yes gene_type:complete
LEESIIKVVAGSVTHIAAAAWKWKMVGHMKKENYRPSPNSPAVFRRLESSLDLQCRYSNLPRLGAFLHIIE